jgi:tetratricopeptide (TPR) repeat protein
MQLLVNSLLIAPWILQPTLSAFAEAIPSSIAVEEKPFSSQLNENFSTREFITGQDIIPESTTATETCSQDNEELETTRVETIFESVVALESTTTLPPFKTQETFSTSETIPTDSFKIEKIVQPIPTTAEIARDRQLAQADKRYQCGELLQAEKLYREVKKPFAAEVNLEKEKIREPISQPEQLQPGGAVYWRLYQEGLEDRHLESKILAPLKLLTEQYPEFIPAHLHYARALKETGKEQEAMQVLQHAITLYPNEVELVQAKIEAHQATEDWLEASLTARQFALFNPKHPRSAEFISIADENLERYKDDLESEITWSAIGNVLVGGIGLALTGNIFGTLSAIETTVLLLEGESSIGDRYSASVQQELPMVRDEEVLGYVREIGN